MCLCVVWKKFIDVSEKRKASIFKVQKQIKQSWFLKIDEGNLY
jgi:hypothetical protein